MIFVTVGTIKYPFGRMADLAEELCKLVPKKKIIFQYGTTKVNLKFPNLKLYDFLSFGKMNEYLESSEIVICSGGPATISQAHSYGKIPFVLPRLKAEWEHVSDHQLEYCRFMRKRGLVKIIGEDVDFADFFKHDSNNGEIKNKLTSESKIIVFLNSLG